jgi:tetratricopeptide (TPR) repeat protein
MKRTDRLDERRHTRLRIGRDETVLAVDGQEVRGPPAGRPSYRLDEQLWEVRRARRERHTRLLALGRGLAQEFLPDPIRMALARHLAQADGLEATLRLAVETDDAWLGDLPWESLVVPEVDPDVPLALHPRIELYRAIPEPRSGPVIRIGGPLRILVAISSPDQGERRDLLDYEQELQRIMDAVEPAQRHGRAEVRILNFGTVAEIHGVLEAQRFHILHVSCHARPGALVMEDPDGQPTLVDAGRFAREVLVAGRGVPLVVLAGCSTALSERIAAGRYGASGERQGEQPEAQGEAALPGLASQLLGHGVPAVLAMNAWVTDYYATRLSARLYQELATQQHPEPLTALSQARRQIDAELRAAPDGSRAARLADLAEWATPVLSLRGASQPLFDSVESVRPVQVSPEPPPAPGIVVRRVGDFVGRRRDQRMLLAGLRGSGAGVVIHGIGGAGKSSLAAQLVSRMGDQGGLIVSMAGQVAVEQVLDEVGKRLLDVCLALGLGQDDPLQRLAGRLREPDTPWKERLGLVAEHLSNRQPVILLLDDFEDNLVPADPGPGHEVRDRELAAFLAAWVRSSGMSRLLITSRHPLVLPEGTDRRLVAHHLGPLSLGETRKLVSRLPGLAQLTPDQLRRAHADVGGHPRALEYLDALLRGGKARFPEVAERLEAALGDQDISDPRDWLAKVAGDLDRALAETITLAVNDVLLDNLVAQVDGVPLARELLLGVSVYRLPVDMIAVIWQAAAEADLPTIPNDERFGQLLGDMTATIVEDRLADTDRSTLPHDDVARRLASVAVPWHPPQDLADQIEIALDSLIDAGLVTSMPAATSGDVQGRYLVHRWTALKLAATAEQSQREKAHHRAATYWIWRFWQTVARPESYQDLVAPLRQARNHYHLAGELDDAVRWTQQLATILHLRGAWAWEQQLCEEALTWVPPRSSEAAAFLGHLGIIAQDRGQYEQAAQQCRRALEIFQERGDQTGEANCYHQLGNVAFLADDYGRAKDWYLRASETFESIGDLGRLANCHHQLGMVAERFGQQRGAEGWYRRALDAKQRDGDLSGAASTCSHLGNLARERGHHPQARAWYQRALELWRAAGNQAGIATCYHDLAIISLENEDYGQARRWSREALEIREGLGDRPGLADSYLQLGNIAYLLNEYEQATVRYRQALDLAENLGEGFLTAKIYYQLGRVAHDRGDLRQALIWYQQGLAIFEELHAQDHTATVISQIGILLTEHGDPAKALAYTLRSLSIRLMIGSSAAGLDLGWLARQRELLGHAAFAGLLEASMDAQSAAIVLRLLQQHGAGGRNSP